MKICTFLSYPIILARTIPPNAEFFSWLLQSMIEYQEHLEAEHKGQHAFFGRKVSLVLEEAQVPFMRWFEGMISVAIHMP